MFTQSSIVRSSVITALRGIMPILSFPCVIHRLGDASHPIHRRIWIKGHDFRTLALAATAQLGAPHDACEYTLVSRESIPKSTFLEVAHATGRAIVGAMAAPLPTDEPRWRESGIIRPSKCVNPRDGRITIAPCLQVARGDYVAHFRLPALPTRALAEWLASRNYDINTNMATIMLQELTVRYTVKTDAEVSPSPSLPPATTRRPSRTSWRSCCRTNPPRCSPSSV
jgi:hypothetical protein